MVLFQQDAEVIIVFGFEVMNVLKLEQVIFDQSQLEIIVVEFFITRNRDAAESTFHGSYDPGHVARNVDDLVFFSVLAKNIQVWYLFLQIVHTDKIIFGHYMIKVNRLLNQFRPLILLNRSFILFSNLFVHVFA
jgi:hypothetical protein